jgi:hypothetical protein
MEGEKRKMENDKRDVQPLVWASKNTSNGEKQPLLLLLKTRVFLSLLRPAHCVTHLTLFDGLAALGYIEGRGPPGRSKSVSRFNPGKYLVFSFALCASA